MRIQSPLFGNQLFLQSSSLPEKTKMVAVLGSSKENPDTQPYLNILKLTSEKLSARGYGIMTGASAGANYYGNWGALPDKSYAIHVQGWESAENRRPDSSKLLYQDYAILKTGAERTIMLNQLCNTLIVSPGGPGSLQEIAVTLENMYYKAPGAPQKLILLGKNFWEPMLQLFNNMVRMGLGDNRLFESVTVLDVPLNNPARGAEQLVQLIVGQTPVPRFGNQAHQARQRLRLLG